MKHLLASFFFLLVALTATAQKGTVSGTIVDSDGEPLPGATIVIMNPDSTQVTGQQTRSDGTFSISSVKVGDYLLRASFVGYKTVFRPISLTKKQRSIALGEITLRDNAQLMKEAEVTARAAQVEMKADTFIYNADAFRIPEGSNFEALLKKFPGAEITEQGTIKINGKEVKKILVNEKEFFGGDTEMTLKNLPADIVSKVRAYDRKSDYSRVTGIDDGEEETVLDLTVKKGMTKGWNLNLDAAGGTPMESSVRDEYPFLYSGKLNLSRFTDNLNLAVMGSINNIGDRGFGGWGRGGSGITTIKNPGANFAWTNGLKKNEAGYMEVGGNVRYRHTTNDVQTKTNSESFLTSTQSQFVNSLSQSLSKNANVNSDFRFEWQPDSMTNIIFRPNFSYGTSDSESTSQSVTFNNSPYDAGMSDPLTEFGATGDDGQLLYKDILVNDNHRQNQSNSHNYNLDGSLQVNRQLGIGRNVTLDLGGSISRSASESYSRSLVNYYQRSRDPFTFTNQYTDNPSKSWNWRVRASYSEPLFKGANLQLSYQFQRRFSDSDRSLYSIDSLLYNKDQYGVFSGMTDAELIQLLVLGYQPSQEVLAGLRNLENSQYATYNEYNHNASLMFRYKFGDFNLNAGVSFQPQTTHMDYQKNRLDTTVVRHVFNWAPRIDLRWKRTNTSQVRARYNARMSQPSMTNLLDVDDTSDPLNVSHGNPGLKPSWTNNFFVFYNDYLVERQMGWAANVRFSNTLNSISNRTVYDVETGKRETTPENINGNWNAGAFAMFNTALDPGKYWNISNSINYNYSNSVGYMSLDQTSTSVKSTTKQSSVGDNMRLNYRNDWLEVGVNGGFNFNHARNAIRESANLDTWNFNYGGNLQINAPWGTSFATDITQESRRGYEDATMNTNELIWNAQVSQSFLKGNALTVSLQWYDILRQRSSISRAISAMQRSDSWSNAIHSYVMVHVIYKLNLFGDKDARREAFGPDGPGGPDRPDRGDRGGRGGDRGGRGGFGGGPGGPGGRF
ncbi:MAG: TonB-dependent receptor [Bacteroidaceae bacterium]|nr:TonB-dependent receptor [Bacteroidaceae bacterium]